MTGKENISATVDPEVASFLEQEHINKSGLINKLLKEHMNGGATENRMLELREEQLESQLESLEVQCENIANQLESVRERQSEMREQEEKRLKDAMTVLETVPWDEDNPAIQQWADDLDMSETELINQLEDYHAE